MFSSPQRKYEFSPVLGVPSTGSGQSGGAGQPGAPWQRDGAQIQPRLDRPTSLPLAPAATAARRKEVSFSGATLVSPETPRPKKAYVLHYQVTKTKLCVKVRNLNYWEPVPALVLVYI